ncbi:MAG: outer membrane protein transport protein [Thermoanaerobaculia bacterium]
MNPKSRILASALLATGLVAQGSPLRAAGFSIFEQGTKAMGMAMAFTAQADDPSAIFYNPGGVAFLDGQHFSLGLTVVTSTEGDFKGANPSPGASARGEQEPLFETPPHFYWTRQINERWRFGLGLTSPFGLTTEWKNPDTFPGRYLSTKAALRTFDLNPTLAWQATPKLGVGFGVLVRFSDVELERFAPQRSPINGQLVNVGQVHLESDLNEGYGFTVGVLHKWNESFSWGLSYRSKVKVDYEGDGRFSQILTGLPPFDAAIARAIPFGQDLPIKTNIEFPDSASLGLAFALSATSKFEIDVNWTGWSSFDAVPLQFTENPQFSQTLPEHWEDAMNYRLGFRWAQGATGEWRVGAYYDETPQPELYVSPLLPDANRTGLTLGWGHRFSTGKTLDLAVLYLPFDERKVRTNANNFLGDYNTTAWLFGATFGL